MHTYYEYDAQWMLHASNSYFNNVEIKVINTQILCIFGYWTLRLRSIVLAIKP